MGGLGAPAAVEGPLNDALSKLGRTMDESVAARKEVAKGQASTLRDSLRDYVLVVQAVKDALNKRLPRWEMLQRRTDELEAAKRADSKLRSAAEDQDDKNMSDLEERLQKSQQAVDEAQRLLDQANENLTSVTKRLAVEMESFRAKWVTDFMAMLNGFVPAQVAQGQRTAKTWGELKESLPCTTATSGSASIAAGGDAPVAGWSIKSTVRVADPAKVGTGVGAFVSYTVSCTVVENGQEHESTVQRRYSDFRRLHKILGENYAGVVVPPIPEACVNIVGKFTTDFMEARRHALET